MKFSNRKTRRTRTYSGLFQSTGKQCITTQRRITSRRWFQGNGTRLVGLFIAVLTLRTGCNASFALGFLLQDHHLHQQRGCQLSQRLVISHRCSQSRQFDVSQKIYYNDQENNDPMERLGIYVYNLQKRRKDKDTKTAKSLCHFLVDNPLLNSSDADHISQSCERALVPAIRTAGDAGDYKLILNLITASISFANGNPILTPRIFGEALDALSQTSANAAKIKQIWKLVAEGPDFLRSPPTAYELNVMLKSVASRGKYRSCIDIYRQHTITEPSSQTVLIHPDAYTASTLFSILSDSISQDQPATTPMNMRSSPSHSNLEMTLKNLSKSPCWQWNTAVELLVTFGYEGMQWNNHAYSSLLKLQDRAKEVFDDHENGSKIAMAILDSMRRNNVIPDVVTCTLIIKAIGDPSATLKSWKLAVRFLEQMATDENLPDPNEYTYSAVIVACARCREFNTALKLLEEMRTGKKEIYDDENVKRVFVPPEPNTWVYNAALLAISKPDSRSTWNREERSQSRVGDAADRRKLALKLLGQMQYDSSQTRMDTKPDTVTYNTILAILGTTPKKSEKAIELTSSLIDQMKMEQIPRDVLTYRNSILACSDSKSILQMLRSCLDDYVPRSKSPKAAKKRPHHSKGLKGKASHGLTFVFDTALSVLASRGDLEMFQEVFSLMQESDIAFSQETTLHLLTVAARSGKSDALVLLLTALKPGESSTSLVEFSAKTGIQFAENKLPPLEVAHYSKAISTCLAEDELDQAQRILMKMRDNDLIPSTECIERFSLAYARSAIRAAVREKKHGDPSNVHFISKERARSAFTIAMALHDPPPFVICTVAKACACTGHWKRARSMLRSLQNTIFSDHSSEEEYHQRALSSLVDLQSGLLRECANQGNVTAALWFVKDIQQFSRKLGFSSDEVGAVFVPASDTNGMEADFLSALLDVSLSDDFKVNVAMRARDWISVMKAARRSGHWRVCVSTLQFLRPYVKRTNPNLTAKDSAGKLKSRYEHLSPALVEAARCLETRSQYAWCVRSINEWMLWSGRKAPVGAVLPAIRALSSRGRGDEVKELLTTCFNYGPTEDYSKKGMSYEEMLYVGAVTSLHRNGLYDDADEIYVTGVSEGYLPFAFETRSDKIVLDLHGLNVAMAHSAVRVAMRQQTAIFNERSTSDMMIITGRGRNSAFHLRPVLRPEIQRMMVEEFYPPLNTLSVPGNMGALLVLADDISRWQEHQEGQKGARMLALAAVLKNLSTNRLRQSIALLEDNK